MRHISTLPFPGSVTSDSHHLPLLVGYQYLLGNREESTDTTDSEVP